MNNEMAMACWAFGSSGSGRNHSASGIATVGIAFHTLGEAAGSAMDADACGETADTGSAIGAPQVVILQHAPSFLIHAAGFYAFSRLQNRCFGFGGHQRQL